MELLVIDNLKSAVTTGKLKTPVPEQVNKVNGTFKLSTLAFTKSRL
jgi:hypothetical protein